MKVICLCGKVGDKADFHALHINSYSGLGDKIIELDLCNSCIGKIIRKIKALQKIKS